jgi:hypothetical protein
MLACGFSFIFALFQVLEYGALLSVAEENAPPVFLQVLYWLQLLFGVGVLFLSIATYVALYSQHVRCLSGGCSLPLLFSRLLRYGMWLSFFAFFFVWFRSDRACGAIRREGTMQQVAELCRCVKETEGQAVERELRSAERFLPVDSCKPKNYHVCESPLVDMYPTVTVLTSSGLTNTEQSEIWSRINDCRWCGLNLDGDEDGDGVIDNTPCTPDECKSLNCRYETKTCPPRRENFEDDMAIVSPVPPNFQSGQEIDECHYDDEGRLTSLNMTAPIEHPDTLVDHYLDTGVLRLTHGTDSGLDYVLERGGLVFANISGINVGLNSSATTGNCSMGVQRTRREAEMLVHECWVIITTGNVMLALLTATISYHYSRVFYSVHLSDCATSRGDTGHVRMDDDSGGMSSGGGGGPPLHARP